MEKMEFDTPSISIRTFDPSTHAYCTMKCIFHVKFKKKAHLVPNIRVRDPGHATWRRASLCPNVLCILIREPDKNQFFHFHVFSKKKITQVSPYGIEIFSQKKCKKKSKKKITHRTILDK